MNKPCNVCKEKFEHSKAVEILVVKDYFRIILVKNSRGHWDSRNQEDRPLICPKCAFEMLSEAITQLVIKAGNGVLESASVAIGVDVSAKGCGR